MAFDVPALVEAARCVDCLSPNQKQNVLLYLLNGILEGGGSGGIVLHNLLSATHPDTVPGPPTRGALVVGNATPDWDALLIGAANRVLRSDGVDATWAQLVLTTDVTGILPIASGGTNSSAALNNNRIMVSSGGTIVEAAALTNGQLLIGSTGAAPVAASLTAGANITITPGAGSITIAATGVVTQAYSTIQEEGAAIPQQSILNFISAALTAADDPGNSRTNVTLAHSALTRVDDTNVTLTLGGSPTTALLAATSLTLGWTGTLSPARGGTGTGTAFTQGSVIFAGVAGVYAEDNANLFWDDTNNRLGIGTSVPAASLELSSNAFPSNNALVITLGNDTSTNFPNIFYRRSRGTVALPTSVLANDRLGGFGFRGYGATGFFTADNAVFRVFAAENFTDTEQGTYFTFESTPIGSLVRLERMRIDTLSISMPPTGTAAGRTNELRFLELAANGVNYTGFRASDAMAASEIYVLPSAAPAANRFLQAAAVAGGASALSWAQASLTADVTGILPVTNGGTGTGTAFTAGSVIFAGAAGVYTEDNANFFYTDATNRLTVNQLNIPATTSATVGGIYFGATRTLHNFGTNNLFGGVGAGNFTMTGSANTSFGQSSLLSVTSGVNNSAFGFQSLVFVTTGSHNTGVGANALLNTAGGNQNTAIGSTALQVNISGSGNVAIGYAALLFNTASNNTAIGESALRGNSSGTQNSAVGVNALTVNSTGTNNTAIGYSALAANTISMNNTAIGSFALFANVDGDANFAMGFQALMSNVSGDNNMALGPNALALATANNNIGIGFQAGNNLTTGSNNIIIGHDIDSPTATNSNTLTIGNLIFGTAINATGVALASGNIGIGVITPLAKFHVTNSAAATVATIIKAAAAQSANLTEWQSSAGAVLTCVDEVGNVGIGTGAPLAPFHLLKSQNSDTALIIENATAGTASRAGFYLTTSGAESAFFFVVSQSYTVIPDWSDSLLIGLDATMSGGAVLYSIAKVRIQNTVGTDALTVTGGNVGIGVTSPTSALHLRAGTTAASTAPLKLNTGTSMTTAEAGAMEFTTDDLFFTITTGAARKRLLMADATAGLTSGKIPIATTNGRLTDLTASAAYTPTNVTTDRAYDANATSVDELGDVLGTLIADLQAVGILG